MDAKYSKRISILKVLFAIFVVLLHSKKSDWIYADGVLVVQASYWFKIFQYVIMEAIPRCAVAGFFYLSAYLLYRKEFSWVDNLKKKVKSLLIPYVIMNTLWTILYIVIHRTPILAVYLTNTGNTVPATLTEWLSYFGIGSEYPILYPVWFLRNLFILNLLSKVIQYLVDKQPKIVLAILLCLYFFVGDLPFDNLWGMIHISDLVAFALGYYSVKFDINLEWFDNKKWVLPVCCSILVLRVLMRDSSIPIVSLLIERLNSISGIVLWGSCFFKYGGKLKNVLLKYSEYSIAIFLFQEMFLTYSNKLLTRITAGHIGVWYLQALLLPWVIIVLIILFCSLLVRLFPRIMKVVLGGRLPKIIRI